MRRIPEGDVDIAGSVSVTFSRPMVPLASHGALEEVPVPVTLTPQPEGKWRWVGTRTIVFQPEIRLPMTTTFTVEVPELEESWTFRTPPPSMIDWYPDAVASTQPVIFVELDQDVDADAIVERFSLSVSGQRVAVEPVDPGTLADEDDLSDYVHDAVTGRWTLFRPVERLPQAAPVRVVLEAGAGSREGPRTRSESEYFEFRTAEPLTLDNAVCRYGCDSRAKIVLTFNNRLDLPDSIDEWLTVEPRPEEMTAFVRRGAIHVEATRWERGSYEFRVADSVTDVFGQSLGASATTSLDLGTNRSMIHGPWRGRVVLDPDGPKVFKVRSTNVPELRARVYRVGPEHWEDYSHLSFSGQVPWVPKDSTVPGTLLADESVRPSFEPNTTVTTAIDLEPFLSDDGLGQLVLLVEPIPKELKASHALVWIQSTKLGITAFTDREDTLVWVTSLADGRALEGASVSVVSKWSSANSVTGATGLATLAARPKNPEVVVVTHDNDVAILPTNGSFRQWLGNELTWYVFADRGVYRPGETAHIKGWLRRVDRFRDGGVSLPLESTPIRFEAKDWNKTVIAAGERSLSEHAGFDFTVEIPEDSESLDVDITSAEASTWLRLNVEEYRAPEFEVSLTPPSGAPVIFGERASVRLEAEYYSGGGIAGSPIRYDVVSRPTSYRPPGHDRFRFGRNYSYERQDHVFEAKTDASGTHSAELQLPSWPDRRARRVEVDATVLDVTRYGSSAETQFLVHPAEHYVGLRARPNFVRAGEPIRIEAIVADVDGAIVPGRVVSFDLRTSRWTREGIVYEAQPSRCELISGPDPKPCELQATEGGRYLVRARVTDDRGRDNETALGIWVFGRGSRTQARKLGLESVELALDKDEYEPGETARVLVISPFAPAEGLLTLRRSGLVESRRFTLDTNETALELDVKEAWIPNLQVQIDVLGASHRLDEDGAMLTELPTRPAMASGTIDLEISTESKRLALTLTPSARLLEPGNVVDIDLEVRRRDDAPAVDAAATIVVVDEAVLALTDYRLSDPLLDFYPRRRPNVHDNRLRYWVQLSDSQDLDFLAAVDVKTTGVSATFRRPTTQPAPDVFLRDDFRTLAHFAPEARTNDQGRVSVQLELPDNLTEFRVYAVATDRESRFGMAESSVRTHLPLMVRAAPPRFLNVGDKFELPIVLQNDADSPVEVDVAVRGTNTIFSDERGQRVTVPANDRIEVRFDAAPIESGDASFQVMAVSSTHADAAAFEIPVLTPATSEAFATYGEIDAGSIAQPVRVSPDVRTDYGGLSVTTSATALSNLADAWLYNFNYEFECNEQLASRLITALSLRLVLDAFDAPGLPDAETLDARIEDDLRRLESNETEDGGWGFFSSEEKAWPYVTVHVTHAIVRATLAGLRGYEDPARRIRGIGDDFPADYSADIRRTISAYALHVRHLAGEDATSDTRQLIQLDGVEALSVEAIGWLLPIVHADDELRSLYLVELRRRLGNRVMETASSARFVTAHDDDRSRLLLQSERRADGVVLDALIATDPDDALIPKLAHGLLAGRNRGRWTTTQENVFALLALGRYFEAFESTPPDFSARAWWGSSFVGEHRFRGHTTETARIDVPMERLVRTGDETAEVVVEKDGPGRLYYRLGLRYLDSSLATDALERGFVLDRTYEAVDDPKDVRFDPNEGIWHVRAGARVRVRLVLETGSRRFHVALADRLPAGFEPLNPGLRASAADASDPGGDPDHWWRRWFSYQRLRDHGAEAFTTSLPPGAHTYTYLTRATTPGVFVVPPAQVENMYEPETFGRTASTRVRVE